MLSFLRFVVKGTDSLYIVVWGQCRDFGFARTHVNTANSSGQFVAVERSEKVKASLCYDVSTSAGETRPPFLVLLVSATAL